MLPLLVWVPGMLFGAQVATRKVLLFSWAGEVDLISVISLEEIGWGSLSFPWINCNSVRFCGGCMSAMHINFLSSSLRPCDVQVSRRKTSLWLLTETCQGWISHPLTWGITSSTVLAWYALRFTALFRSRHRIIDPSALGVTTTEFTYGVNSFCTSLMIRTSVNLSSSLLYPGCRWTGTCLGGCCTLRDTFVYLYVVGLSGEQTNPCKQIFVFFQ